MASIHTVASDAKEPTKIIAQPTKEPAKVKTIPTPAPEPTKTVFATPNTLDISVMSVDVLDFYQRHTIQASHTKSGPNGSITLTITNKTDGSPFVGPLPAVIGIIPYLGYANVSQTMIEYLPSGVATISYTTKSQSDTVIISFDNQTYTTIDV